jgi:hypothetical protein
MDGCPLRRLFGFAGSTSTTARIMVFLRWRINSLRVYFESFVYNS